MKMSALTHLMTCLRSLVSSSPSLLCTLLLVLSPLKPLPLTSTLSRITHYTFLSHYISLITPTDLITT